MKLGTLLKSSMLSVMILVLLLCACREKKTETPEVKTVFKIGMIYPLSGAAAYVGEAGKAAVKIFEEENAGDKYKYEFIWEDSQLNAARAATLARNLINVDQVDALMTIGSSNANAVAPIAEENKVLHFAVANTPEASIGAYNFTMATQPAKEAEKLLNELKKRGYRKAALITGAQSFTQAASSQVRNLAAAYGVELVLDESVDDGERDFQMLADKIVNAKPEIVIVNLYVPEISLFAKQLKDMFPDVRITGIETLAFPEDKNLLEGYWFVDQTVPQKEFVEKLKKVTGKDAGNFAENIYASLQLINESLREEGNDKAQMIEFLQSGKEFDTVLGKVAMDKNGRLQSSASTKTIKDGQVVSGESELKGSK